jgi:transcription elongation factor Elf1
VKRARVDFHCPHCGREYQVYLDLSKLPRVRTWAVCSRCQKGFKMAPDRVVLPDEVVESGSISGAVLERVAAARAARNAPADLDGAPELPALDDPVLPEPPPDLELEPAPRPDWLELVDVSLDALTPSDPGPGATSLERLLRGAGRRA